MPERPYTILSGTMSLDGYLDDATDQRLILSNEADFDRVDELRARSDAIFVGAGTVRADDPRLLVRSVERRKRRLADGRSESPAKVTITRSGDLPPHLRFFTTGSGERLVYCPAEVAHESHLADAATVVAVRSLRAASEDLWTRGIRRLLVEGGGDLYTQFLTDGLADELHLSVAPFFVGDGRARRFVDDARFPWHAGNRARLVETRPVGDVVLLRYDLSG